jgi:hypothetical protein
LPARVDTAAWHEIVARQAAEIRFLRGRLHFGDRDKNRAPFPSALVVFSPGRRRGPRVVWWDWREAV